MKRHNLIELITLELASDMEHYCKRMELPMLPYGDIREFFRGAGLTDEELHDELDGIRTDMVYPMDDVYEAIAMEGVE